MAEIRIAHTDGRRETLFTTLADRLTLEAAGFPADGTDNPTYMARLLYAAACRAGNGSTPPFEEWITLIDVEYVAEPADPTRPAPTAG